MLVLCCAFIQLPLWINQLGLNLAGLLMCTFSAILPHTQDGFFYLALFLHSSPRLSADTDECVRVLMTFPAQFVEFENEMQSGVAMQRLQGVQMEGQAIKISFSKA